jgi:hypothetical protein
MKNWLALVAMEVRKMVLQLREATANSVSALRRRLSGGAVALTPASIDLADARWEGAIPSE